MSPQPADDARWAAILRRDASADGSFFYSVATTGVFCRPSCGARLPLRDNVAFHPSAEQATAAGFRPCKRCRPEEPPLSARRVAVVAALCRLIETSEAQPSLPELARAAGWSPSHTHRVFKAVTGVTPKAYASAHRANRLREELRRAPSVTTAVYDAGFGSSSRFYERSNELLGMTPTDYRAGGARREVRFAVGQCSLGAILVAATDRGVSAISLGADPDALIAALVTRLPHAELVGADPAFERLVAIAVGLVDNPQADATLPLDIRGTAFQRRVWEALRRIPMGSTQSYAAIAAAIGAPRAHRAVARACAQNELAVAIPCHRVVRSDGGLSGYRWGVDTKQRLLDREKRAAALSEEPERSARR